VERKNPPDLPDLPEVRKLHLLSYGSDVTGPVTLGNILASVGASPRPLSDARANFMRRRGVEKTIITAIKLGLLAAFVLFALASKCLIQSVPFEQMSQTSYPSTAMEANSDLC
jgi:hypothetical protein